MAVRFDRCRGNQVTLSQTRRPAASDRSFVHPGGAHFAPAWILPRTSGFALIGNQKGVIFNAEAHR